MENANLTGNFLIAMPAMVDPYFAKSLTYICEHNEHGALGIVINRPIDMSLGSLFEQIGVSLQDPTVSSSTVYFGGPVQTDRGFVLHQPVGEWNSTLPVGEDIGLTTSKDILEAVANGVGPTHFIVTLGYAGWAAGQLEQELAKNAWLNVRADSRIIFELPWEKRLQAAMSTLGVDLAALSDTAGHA